MSNTIRLPGVEPQPTMFAPGPPQFTIEADAVNQTLMVNALAEPPFASTKLLGPLFVFRRAVLLN